MVGCSLGVSDGGTDGWSLGASEGAYECTPLTFPVKSTALIAYTIPLLAKMSELTTVALLNITVPLSPSIVTWIGRPADDFNVVSLFRRQTDKHRK